MITFLFWNVSRRFPEEVLGALIAEWNVDVLVLAEVPSSAPDTIQGLPRSGGRVPTALTIYSRWEMRPIEETRRWTIRSWESSEGELLLVAVHLPSPQHFDEASRTMEAAHFAREIRDVEDRRGHRRTILVGDLNMNPFEPGVVGAEGLHAISSRAIAAEGSRTIQGREYPFFYNPMWGQLGDRGTYFYRKSVPLCYFWNAFDQILLRPSLLPFWLVDELRILTGIGDITFIDSMGRPSASHFSDHLPILFRLEL